MQVGGASGIRMVGREPLARAHVGADPGVVPLVREEEVRAEARVPAVVGLDPEAVGVAAEQGEHLAVRQLRAAPRGGRPQRRGEPGLAREPLQRHEMPGPVVELVLELDTDDRPTRLCAPVQGLCQPAEPLPDEVQVGRVVAAVVDRGILHPLRESAVARLTVTPRADPQDQLEAGRGDLVDERGDVEVAVERGLPADGLVMVPEHIRRGDRDARRAHLPQSLAPARAGQAAVVQLARHRHPADAVTAQRAVGDGQPACGLGGRGLRRGGLRRRPPGVRDAVDHSAPTMALSSSSVSTPGRMAWFVSSTHATPASGCTQNSVPDQPPCP